jgi:glycosyltransferase involved in cell wall biosynthesis
MPERELVVVHNNIDDRSAIGAIAKWAVEAGLERDWHIRAVCRDLDPRLVGQVEHVPLYVPPRLHLVQWAAARRTVVSALRGRRGDAMLVYQPQIAALADVWHVEYLSRAARDLAAPRQHGIRPAITDAQAAGVAVLEDAYLRRLPESTRVLFCSEGLRDQFEAIFGPRANSAVLHNPALLEPPPKDLTLPDERRRSELTHGHRGPVVGFLGGGDPRKGGDLIVEALRQESDVFLLHAGPSRLDASSLGGRARDLGHLRDVTELLDVIDVLLVPSRFEPFGLVVLEAAARGVPVVVGPNVGAGPLLLEAGAGAVWRADLPLRPIVDGLLASRSDIARAGLSLIDRVSPERLAAQLFADLDAAAERNRMSRS